MKYLVRTLTVLILFCLSSFAKAQESTCYFSGSQACKTCEELESAIDLERPNDGDYFGGTQWNGLFAAYRLNCPILGVALIAAGANPASGGLFGSMILTVSGDWPHDDRKTNEAWAAMLLLTGLVTETRVGGVSNKTTKELLSEYSFEPEYPDIYDLFDR